MVFVYFKKSSHEIVFIICLLQIDIKSLLSTLSSLLHNGNRTAEVSIKFEVGSWLEKNNRLYE